MVDRAGNTKGLLVKPGEHTQASRQIRFTNVLEILRLEHVLTAYIHEAIDVEKAGLKVKLRKTADLEMPEEFQTKLDENPARLIRLVGPNGQTLAIAAMPP